METKDGSRLASHVGLDLQNHERRRIQNERFHKASVVDADSQ